MAAPSPSPNSAGGASLGTSPTATPTYPGTPRWVKVSGIVALVVVLIVVGVMAVAGGDHGPRRHLPAGVPGDPGGQAAPVAPGMRHA